MNVLTVAAVVVLGPLWLALGVGCLVLGTHEPRRGLWWLAWWLSVGIIARRHWTAGHKRRALLACLPIVAQGLLLDWAYVWATGWATQRGPGWARRAAAARLPTLLHTACTWGFPSPVGGRNARHRRQQSDDGGPARQPWIVPSVFPAGEDGRAYVSALSAARGSMKSLLLADLALALVTGGRWLDFPVMRVERVLYVDVELTQRTFARRLLALARGRHVALPAGAIRYLGARGLDLTVRDHRHQRDDASHRDHRLAVVLCALFPPLLAPLFLAWFFAPLFVRPAASMDLDWLRTQVEGSGADVVLLDSTSLAAPGTAASDGVGWMRLVQALETLGVPVVALDHLVKDGSTSGSWTKEALWRGLLKLSRPTPDDPALLLVEHPKANFGPQLAPFHVRATIENDADGELHAVSFARVAGDAPAIRAAAPKAPRRKRAVAAALH